MTQSTTDDRPWVDLLLRKSKVVREGEDALSIRAQEDRGRLWADENGYRVRKVWKENLSAWSDVKRPKYDAAMDAVLAGEVPCLWVYAMDRFSRKGAEAVVPILGKARVIFDYERLDSMDERDRRWIIDRAENAREYSNRLSHNVTSTKARQRREAKWLSRAPFGLSVNKETKKLSPNRAKVPGFNHTPWQIVLRIFREIVAGISARRLAIKFNDEGIPSPWGKPWRAETIRYIVHNPVYEGWLTVTVNRKPVPYLDDSGKRVIVAADKRTMIPTATAEKARQVLKGHLILDNTPVEGRPKYWLTERTRCAGCDYAMTLNGTSYQCSGPDCPSPAMAYRPPLEAYVLGRWHARLSAADNEDPLLSIIADRLYELRHPKESTELREAQAAVREANAALDKFHQDDRDGFYKGRSARYRLPTKREAEEKLDAAEARVKELTGGSATDVTFLLEGHSVGAWEAADDAMKRDLIGLAIDYVKVCKAPEGSGRFDGPNRVEIVWATVDGDDPDQEDLTEAA
ncbi:recombinase family protein [Streptomyces nojiriensis]|uniref:recombinase family protein n=1 Tax=Streptomyces nojiriensis TaxID=66374 RepID=UPI0036DE72F1